LEPWGFSALVGTGVKAWIDRRTENRTRLKERKDDLRKLGAAFLTELTKLDRVRRLSWKTVEPPTSPITTEAEMWAEYRRRVAAFQGTLDAQTEAVELALNELALVGPEDLIVCARDLVIASLRRAMRDAVERAGHHELTTALGAKEDYEKRLHDFRNLLRVHLGIEPLPKLLTLDEMLDGEED
jgi:hypothetical protein